MVREGRVMDRVEYCDKVLANIRRVTRRELADHMDSLLELGYPEEVRTLSMADRQAYISLQYDWDM